MLAEARAAKVPGRVALMQDLLAQRNTAMRRSRKAWATAMLLLPRDGDPLPTYTTTTSGDIRTDLSAADGAGRFMSIAAKLQDVAIKATARALDLVSDLERAAAIAEEQRNTRNLGAPVKRPRPRAAA